MEVCMKKLSNVLSRVFVFFLSILCLFYAFSDVIIGVGIPSQNLSYAEAIQKISQKQVESITLYSNDEKADLYLKGDKATRYLVNIPNQEAFCEYVQENISTGDALEMKKIAQKSIWIRIFYIFIGIMYMRKAFRKTKKFQKTNEELKKNLVEFSMGTSVPKADFSKNIQKPDISFANVAGLKEEKEELAEIIEFLKKPQKFTEMGARMPKGALLSGPPGTGKTLLAKAVAGEAGVAFLPTCGSDFDNKYVGVGASRIRELFEYAKEQAPCIIFIDEIDAVGKKRNNTEERWSSQTLEQLLVEMDGFDSNTNIFVMGATNRPEVLDPALTRPGRIDRNIVVNLPDAHDREEILKIHAKNKRFMDDVSFSTISQNSSGFSGAELENLLNEAAILAVRQKRLAITTEDIDEALRKVALGLQKKGRNILPEARRLTAYHEAGHAVVSKFLKTQESVKEISIIPRGNAGGYTWHQTAEDRTYSSKTGLTERLVVLLGGRVAEQIALGDISTGASEDLNVATRIARDMICVYGMNDEIGPVSISNQNDAALYGGQEIGKAIAQTVKEAEKRAMEILNNNRSILDTVAETLLAKETISGEEFEELFN